MREMASRLAQSVSEADGRNTYRSRMSSVSVRSQQTVASTDAREKEERVTQNGSRSCGACFSSPATYGVVQGSRQLSWVLLSPLTPRDHHQGRRRRVMRTEGR